MASGRTKGLRYPIRAVAQMTGLSVDTLRAWERRYDAVAPGRNDRGRLYSDADVARLKQLGELVKRGHAIGTIAGLAEADLAGLLKRADALTTPPEAAPVAKLELLKGALDRYDLDAIEATLNRHAAVLPPRDLVFAVILPMLQEIGRRWEAGNVRPAQEHLVSAIVRSVLGGLLRATMRPNASPKIVFATPAGERHELGLLCAALLTASAGYGVVYLGPDLPAADISHAATTAGARVVIVSLTNPGAVTRGEMRTLARIGQAGVELWVGGPEAQSLLSTATGSRLRHIDRLDNVVPMLSRHVS
jgi:MerR family transcriptional regulator, light-induced transcriptional regulator